MTLKTGKGPVVHLPRIHKARMIETVLQDFLNRRIAGFRILDVGTGNGDIAEYFARENRVDSIDIRDQRHAANDSFRFTLVDSADMPFAEGVFDIVISNHVIEHVRNQNRHLLEINRVLSNEGICYLGTPNRSSFIMGGHKDNRQVLRYRHMGPLFSNCGFSYVKYTARMLKQPVKFHCEVSLGRFIPKFLLESMDFIYPSHVFVLWPAERSSTIGWKRNLSNPGRCSC